ncbi:MAG: hypothetical protein K2M94_04350 [Paramuribaculum sp.]|nr:hypothetical protein [Paramuribaculum sp.]
MSETSAKINIFVPVNRIFTHIQYLLLHHDCVVLPSVGAFVVRYNQAHLSADGTCFAPPMREVSFNASINHDDGLLITSVSRNEGISYEDARLVVTSEVELMRHSLATVGEVCVPRVGKLMQSDGILSFEPTENDSIENVAYMLLPELTLRPLDAVDLPQVVLPVSRASRLRKAAVSAVRYAAVATGLIFVSVLASTPLLVKDANIDKASIKLPEISAPKVISINQAEKVTSEEKPEIVAVDAVPTMSEIPVKDDSDYKCFVIVSSWETARQAQRYIAEAKDGKDMKVLEADGRYRVYVKATDDYAAASAYSSHDKTFAQEHPDAWVYVRR